MPEEAGRRKSEERETHPFDRPPQRLLRLLKVAGLATLLQRWVRRQLALLSRRRIFGSNTCHPSLDSSLSSFLPPAFRHLMIRGGTDRRRELCVESTEKRVALPTGSPRAFPTPFSGTRNVPVPRRKTRVFWTGYSLQPSSGAVCFQFKRRAPCESMHCTRVSNHHYPPTPTPSPLERSLPVWHCFISLYPNVAAPGRAGWVGSRNRESRGRACKPVVARSHFLVAI